MWGSQTLAGVSVAAVSPHMLFSPGSADSRTLCGRVIGETSGHTHFPSFLTTLASGLHVFQSLSCILMRLSAALISALPQCHLLCILETHFWLVLMCSLVLSVSISLVCGLGGKHKNSPNHLKPEVSRIHSLITVLINL